LCEIGVWIWYVKLAKQMFYHLSHTTSPFCYGYFDDDFGDGVVSETVYLGWPQTTVF
jgi:hypothetical protein